ncbi:condensation domain-containing protein [Streptomyces sp. CC210A]|uniref:condensation domain-containing protein n=1 Tax=Streptomyces sp. CC210A TaxID=2898184 RepID=UPI001F1ED80C|nr:condensation domain-containing protein [Streptomyces sp. CC210A]
MSATSERLRPPRPYRVGEVPPGGRTETFVLRLTGVLPYVYEQAWQAVLEPTALCRTVFRRLPDGGMRRTLRPAAPFRLQVADWRATRAEVQDARLEERLAEERARGLPLDRAPLVRATLIRRDDRTWTFAWRYARPVLDRRAGLRLMADAADAYRRLLRGAR